MRLRSAVLVVALLVSPRAEAGECGIESDFERVKAQAAQDQTPEFALLLAARGISAAYARKIDQIVARNDASPCDFYLLGACYREAIQDIERVVAISKGSSAIRVEESKYDKMLSIWKEDASVLPDGFNYRSECRNTGKAVTTDAQKRLTEADLLRMSDVELHGTAGRLIVFRDATVQQVVTDGTELLCRIGQRSIVANLGSLQARFHSGDRVTFEGRSDGLKTRSAQGGGRMTILKVYVLQISPAAASEAQRTGPPTVPDTSTTNDR